MEYITPEQALAKYEENQKVWIAERREELLKMIMLDGPLTAYREVCLTFDDDGDLQYVRAQLALARIWNNLPESIEFGRTTQVIVCCKYANVAFGARECPNEEGLSPILVGLFASAHKHRVAMLASMEENWEKRVQLYLDNPHQSQCVFTVSGEFKNYEFDWARISAIAVAERYASRKFIVVYEVFEVKRPEDLAIEQYTPAFTIVLKK